MSKCPYCNMEVSETAIELEDGCCPECGAMISAPDLTMNDGEEDDEFDPEAEQDIFSDLEEDAEFQHDDLGGDVEDFDDAEFDDEEFDDEEGDDEEF